MDGDAASEAAELETFKDQLEESRAKGSSMPDDTEAFTAAYKKHADLVQDSAGKHEFKEVETSLKDFWIEWAAWAVRGGLEDADVLAMCDATDEAMYTGIMTSLIPDVFMRISEDLTKEIRKFSKKYDFLLRRAIEATPDEFKDARVRQAVLFGQKLRRYTGLNHLAKAARAVLSKPEHVKQMQDDYGRIDFVNVQEQVAWVCEGCDVSLIAKHETAFRKFNNTENSLEKWAGWLQGIVNDRLGLFDGKESYNARASELLLRWSFISSLIVRDLTLRSASSFGPFHLMRLLCDEYMYFLVETALSEQSCRPCVHIIGGGTEIDVGTNAADVYASELAKTGQTAKVVVKPSAVVDAAASAKRTSATSANITGDMSSTAKRPKLK